MLTLGIETSGRGGEVALLRGDELLGSRSLSAAGRRHAQTLVSEMAGLWGDAGIGPAELEAVAVSIGPGSFTGLRVGVVCAKTLAYAVRRPLAAVDTFLAVAAQSPAGIDRVQVISDAQRGELYLGRYERRADGWERFGDVRIVDGGSWRASLAADDAVSGPGVAKHLAQLAGRCRIVNEESREPRAETVARLGQAAIRAGRTADPAALEPFYLRRSAAEEKRDSPPVAP
ncbi:MAG: tRNA (adenosine(37)-N6)-threonylcarbamoyltransferase complex dimerization subunit type 1 TsaB [Planctomycetales bacterium]